MRSGHPSRSGARLLVDALAKNGVERVFCVPGESYLSVLDALYEHRSEIAVWLREALPEDAVVTDGAGDLSSWMHRFHCYRRLGRHLAPISGSTGYGVPAAIAAKLRHPGRAAGDCPGRPEERCFLPARCRLRACSFVLSDTRHD